MSFSNNPFDRMSHFDPESKLSEWRKKFFHDIDQNKMFTDSTNRWPNGLGSHSMNLKTDTNRFGAKEEGIPIKVIHEKSDEPTNNESNDEKNFDSMSSSQSQRSGDTSNSVGSGRSFHSNQSSNSSGSEPRVYHIPISIEPRDVSNSTVYTSEGNANNEQPLSRSSSHSSGKGIGSGGQLRAERRSFSPANNVSEKTELKTDNKEPISQIPVEVKSEPKQRSVSPLKESTQNKSNDSKPKTKPKSGPFVTRIPVVNQSVIPPQMDESSPELNTKCDPKGVPNIDSLERINEILSELQKYDKQINQFEGTTDDKNYRYLDEMLTRLMIKLDTIDTFGREDIRKARKSAVLIVNKYITLLEQRIRRTEPKVQIKDVVKDEGGSAATEKCEPMQISTPEPIQQLKDNNQEMTESNVNGSQTGSSSGQNQSKSQTNEKPNETQNSTPNQRKETAV